jgi:hypothetical protein
MSGEIIEFRRHYDLRRARRRRRKRTVPCSPTGQVRLEQQIARISDLLEEFEDLAAGPNDLPSPILAQARASIDKANRIFTTSARFVVNARQEENGEANPQPHVDREILERMYRELNPHT